ncbi:MAG: type II toxin-antitoxin system RelE/ParE family toxin [Dehalococcoidia bacterium]
MASVVFTRAAIREARDARVWLQDRQPKTVQEFRVRLRTARATLQEFPTSGSVHLFGTRRYQLSPYPYYIVYRTDGAVVTILAVAHSKQRPGYWRNR